MFYLYLQAYKAALESLGHSEYALKAGFHLNPKAVESALQVGSLLKRQEKASISSWIECEVGRGTV